MSVGPQLFISFSSQDQHAVRTLFSALQLQGINCWDYSAVGQELPLGHSVQESLKERIDACDYFIAIVSSSTTHETFGRFPRFELEYAIGQGLLERRKILPVLLVSDPPTEWSGPYKQLQPFRWVEFDATDAKAFDERINEICGKLEVSYVPPSLRDPRVFFSKYLLEEAGMLELSNAQFIQLMQIMNRCAEEVAKDEWDTAKKLISSFLQLSSVILPRVQLNYPIIVKGVCELRLGEFGEAERTFTMATEASGPKAQYFAGLGYAGLGHASFNQQRFDEARASFNRASELLPNNKDIEFNLSVIDVGGVNMPEDPPGEPGSTTPEDYAKVKLRGIFHYKTGEYQAAIDAFQSLEGALDEVSSIYLSSAHRNCGNENEALEVLRTSASRLKSTNLYHHLASAFLSSGYVDESVEIYERVLCQPDRRTRQYIIEYARILKAVGGQKMNKKVRDLCALVLEIQSFSHSNLTGEDFYYMGFANYLLGRNELAKYEFERSRGFCEKYYDHEEFQLG